MKTANSANWNILEKFVATANTFEHALPMVIMKLASEGALSALFAAVREVRPGTTKQQRQKNFGNVGRTTRETDLLLRSSSIQTLVFPIYLKLTKSQISTHSARERYSSARARLHWERMNFRKMLLTLVGP